jgi:hypothetical protein
MIGRGVLLQFDHEISDGGPGETGLEETNEKRDWCCSNDQESHTTDRLECRPAECPCQEQQSDHQKHKSEGIDQKCHPPP